MGDLTDRYIEVSDWRTDASGSWGTPKSKCRGGPTMNEIRCPECGSDDVVCIDKPHHHDHLCHHCGYSMLHGAAAPSVVEPSEPQQPVASLAADALAQSVFEAKRQAEIMVERRSHP